MRCTFARIGKKLPLIATGFAAVVMAGCGYISPQHLAARAIEKRLPSLIGPARSYDVSVAGSALELARGHASEVKIHGVGVQVNSALLIDDFAMDSHDLTFDRSTHKLTHAGDTAAVVSIGADNLSNYLHARHPKWSNVELSFVNQDIVAQLPMTILGQTSSVKVNGKFLPNPKNPSDIDLHVDSATIASVPVPTALVNLALDRLNPIVSLNGLRFPVTIQNTSITNNQLVVQGTVQIAP